MIKRIIDITAAAAGLAVFSPLLLLLSFLIWHRMGSPVLFRQKRPGLHGVPFEMIKFRTMSNEIDHDGTPLPDSKRLNPFGRFLRSTSLDELPELWNVLRGDMSVVGPRPLLMEYMDVYTDEEKSRHDVRPGITGLAQVHGRNDMSWDDKLQMDLTYVRRHNLWMDLHILLLTLVKVFKREGVLERAPQGSLSEYRRGDKPSK